MKTDRELYDEALAIIDDNLQVVEGIIGNRFATASLIVEFAKRQVNNLDIPVVSKSFTAKQVADMLVKDFATIEEAIAYFDTIK